MRTGLIATGRGWRVGVLTALVTGWVAAGVTGAAVASEIVDLRIGAHEEFTRVVFELDRPTGYRVERASPQPGVSELVISIDATSIPRKVQAKNALIGTVKITPRGKGALAEIRLMRDGLRLKEMILSSPPRIVLDILASPSAKKPAATRGAVAKKAASPKATAKAEKKAAVKPTAKAKPVAKPKKVAPAPKPAPVSVAKTPSVVSPAKPADEATSAKSQKEAEVVVRTTPSAEVTPGVKLLKPRRMIVEPNLARPSDPEEPMGSGLAVLELEAEEVVPSSSLSSRRNAEVLEGLKDSNEEEDSGSGALWATLIGIVAMSIVFMAMRRRRAAGRPDELDEGVEVGGSAAEGDNPFSSRATSAPVSSFAPEENTEDEAMPDIELDLADMDEDPEKEAAPVDGPFSPASSPRDAEAPVSAQSHDFGSGASGSEEMERLAVDFERRTESLERRLEEASEARERLERQVAAQTEELRVQRAAIARTQRAVRNMNRPEEDGATEPTPRNS